MKKIDAKLVAYLAGEDMKPKEEKLVLDRLKCTSPISQLVGEMVQERFREQQMKIYQRVNSLKMHLEALTLQPAGTKFMELLEEDIKPIFTVECQLSHELIKNISRYDMFHIMQFESGQFQSLTQCTRFAQDAQRDIHLEPKYVVDENTKHENGNGNGYEKEDEAMLNFGKLSFIVWWRQPGTCLNEMLGMAVFDLEELYQASLLEQCKCLAIKRRNIHMANLYFKISMLLRRNSNGEVKMLKEYTVVKECNGGGGGGGSGGTDEEQQSAKQSADAKEAKNIENAAAKGEKPNDKAADMKKGS